jgi:hypothetical protein
MDTVLPGDLQELRCAAERCIMQPEVERRIIEMVEQWKAEEQRYRSSQTVV